MVSDTDRGQLKQTFHTLPSLPKNWDKLLIQDIFVQYKIKSTLNGPKFNI